MKNFKNATHALAALIFLLALTSNKAKALYGEDDRKDYYQIKNSQIQEVAKAIAYRVDKHELRGWTFRRYWGVVTKRFSDKNVCAGERFRDQQTIRVGCSAVLVADDVLLTAGNCLSDHTCRNDLYYWTFGFYQTVENQDFSSYHSDNFFKCDKIIKRSFNPSTGMSYVLFKLKKYVSMAKPVEIEKNDENNKNNELIIMGHPNGLPLKIADNAFRYHNNPNHFTANSDIAGETSGALAFDKKTLKLQGLLIQGTKNYHLSPDANCYKPSKYFNDEAQERFLKASAISAIKEL